MSKRRQGIEKDTMVVEHVLSTLKEHYMCLNKTCDYQDHPMGVQSKKKLRSVGISIGHPLDGPGIKKDT